VVKVTGKEGPPRGNNRSENNVPLINNNYSIYSSKIVVL
jgi:hypothetical protein